MNLTLRSLICAILILALPSLASATVYFVKVGGTGTGTSSWSNAFGTLEEAFAVAVAGDEILVQEGTYKPRDSGTGRNRTLSPPAGVALRGGYISSTDPGAPDGSFALTVLSGDIGTQGIDTDNCYNVVTLDGLGHSNQVTIDGLKITAGYADGTGTDGQGGAVRSDDSDLYLEHSIVRDNYALEGGGLHFRDGLLESRKCRVRDNLADQKGGRIFLEVCSEPAIVNVKFRDNGGSVDKGGAIYVGEDVTDLEVTQCVMHDNDADTGGAVYIADPGTSGSGASMWTNNTIAYNTSTTTGAGMYIEDHTGGSTDPFVHNAIHYFNPQTANNENIVLASGAGVTVLYSDIGLSSGTWTGTGNINQDPVFRNTTARNLRLKRANPASPCIDAGDDTLLPQDRLDLDDDGVKAGAGGELLPLDFDLFSNPDNPNNPSYREEDVSAVTDTGNDAGAVQDAIVDMGAYEAADNPDDQGGGGV